MSQSFQYQITILSSSDLIPVSYSTISWGNNEGTISDENGFARLNLNLKDSDTIKISCIGYSLQKVSVNSLSRNYLNKVILTPNVFVLDDLQINKKKKKSLNSKEILRRAISAIEKNYPVDTLVYYGYYREYTKQEKKYINVLEAIIDLQDPGIKSFDDFQSKLYFIRANQSFQIDSMLLVPYDNQNKLVPFSIMPTHLSNELLMLRVHDPIRNYKNFSFDFIGRLQKDCIANHDFIDYKITYLDETPYYFIQFTRDLDAYYYSAGRIRAEGYMYINALNYGIKKLNYKVHVERELSKYKLFEVTTEYSQQGDSYYLKYISFNNLYRNKDLILEYQKFEPSTNTVTLHFNRELNIDIAANVNGYEVFYDNSRLLPTDINVNGNEVEFKLRGDSKQEEKLKVNILWLNYNKNQNEESNKFKSYYQYREFFVNEIKPEKRLKSNLMDKTKPVFQNTFPSYPNVDTSWLNTPLITEDIQQNKVNQENRKILESIRPLYKINELKRNDILYIHTDREVYSTGDTVWLKAYILSKADLKPSDNSDVLFLQLVDQNGKTIEKYQFLIFDGFAKGQFQLKQSLNEGYYYLVGNSSWMTNYEAENVFRKKILIKKERQVNYEFIPAFNKTDYFPGDTVKISIQCLDNFNRELKDVPFNFNVKTESGTNIKNIDISSNVFESKIDFVIPADIHCNLSLEVFGKHKGKSLVTNRTIKVKHAIHIDFFPEGGHYNHDQQSKLAFKAITNSGEPIDVKGEIINDKGKTILNVASQHDGMGIFSFTPVKDKNFYFKVTEPLLLIDTFRLPAAYDEGWSLSANYEGNIISVTVTNTNKKEEPAFLILKIRDHLYYDELVYVKQKKQIDIPTNSLPLGIGVITLFDGEMNPRAERLVFVNKENTNNISLQSGSNYYMPRDSVHLKIKVSNPLGQPVSGAYSLSIVDDELCSSPNFEEANVVSSLILSPEINGSINNINYYANFSNPVIMSHLDLLLLTQGWRNYNYVEKLNEVDSIQPPKNQDIISGQVKKERYGRNSEPIKAVVSVFFGGQTTDILTDENGFFSFLLDYNTTKNPNISLFARDKNDNRNIEILLDTSNFNNQLQSYLHNILHDQPSTVDPVFSYLSFKDKYSIDTRNYKWIDEVIIMAKRQNGDNNFDKTDNIIAARTAKIDQLENAFDIYGVLERMGKMVDMDVDSCTGFSYPVIKVWYQGEYTSIHWYINGAFYTSCVVIGSGSIKANDYRNVSNILPKDIERLTLVLGMDALAFYGPGYNAVVDINYTPKLSNMPLKSNLFIKGPIFSKDFYSPIYNTPQKRESPIPDLRKTIYWEPNIELDENGEVELVFYNADRYAKIKCVFEGISNEGIPSSKQMYYNVSVSK